MVNNDLGQVGSLVLVPPPKKVGGAASVGGRNVEFNWRFGGFFALG